MFVIKRFYDESIIRHFKYNILEHTYQLKFDIHPRNIGLYSNISHSMINIKNVSENEDRGGPIFMHFYGIIFMRKYLIGIICPQMLYTLFTIGVWLIRDEYLYIKFFALIIWFYIYVSNIDSANLIHNKLIEWMQTPE